MAEAMATGRMDQDKKKRVSRILSISDLNASQAINLMYVRIERDGNADFLTGASSHAINPVK